jgi:hypothetical protein
MTRLKDGPGEKNNPIVQYQEWAEHRYDPGHWVGGNIPPSTRNFWSGTNRRWLGGVYLATCAVAAAYAFYYARNSDDLILALLPLSIYLIPGLIMLFARERKRRRRQRESRLQSGQSAAFRSSRHHGHGRFSDH